MPFESIPLPREKPRPAPLRTTSEPASTAFDAVPIPLSQISTTVSTANSPISQRGAIGDEEDSYRINISSSPLTPAKPRRQASFPTMVPSNDLPLTPDKSPKTIARKLEGIWTPPITPSSNTRKYIPQEQDDTLGDSLSSLDLDFDPKTTPLLGTGQWSKVYKVLPNPRPAALQHQSILTPPATPQNKSFPGFPQAFAVKRAMRSDGASVLENESRILSYLNTLPGASSYIIPFHGTGPSKDTLILHCANAGSLESYTAGLNDVPEPERSATVRRFFPSIASQLISGLAFLHSAGIVHADIKPANILLDTDASGALQARFCDFSASFHQQPPSSTSPLLGDHQDLPTSSPGGGTWDFMAPEQLSRDPVLSAPSFASDVWSLGVTLLYFLLGGSPYKDAASNLFMLREAVKMGNPMGFARGTLEGERRLEQAKAFGAIDCLVLALRGNRDQRIDAAGWRDCLSEQNWGQSDEEKELGLGINVAA